jgi:hypothetical protein
MSKEYERHQKDRVDRFRTRVARIIAPKDMHVVPTEELRLKQRRFLTENGVWVLTPYDPIPPCLEDPVEQYEEREAKTDRQAEKLHQTAELQYAFEEIAIPFSEQCLEIARREVRLTHKEGQSRVKQHIRLVGSERGSDRKLYPNLSVLVDAAEKGRLRKKKIMTGFELLELEAQDIFPGIQAVRAFFAPNNRLQAIWLFFYSSQETLERLKEIGEENSRIAELLRFQRYYYEVGKQKDRGLITGIKGLSVHTWMGNDLPHVNVSVADSTQQDTFIFPGGNNSKAEKRIRPKTYSTDLTELKVIGSQWQNLNPHFGKLNPDFLRDLSEEILSFIAPRQY